MPGPKKKTIEELEMEVAELITKSGRCEQDMLTDSNDYRALKQRINNPGASHNNKDLQKMKDLHSSFLLCQSIIHKRKKIQAAPKAADASAATSAASNVVNTSISSPTAAADSSTSSSTTANKLRASIDYML